MHDIPPIGGFFTSLYLVARGPRCIHLAVVAAMLGSTSCKKESSVSVPPREAAVAAVGQVQQCDLLTSHPDDPTKPGSAPGVSDEQLASSPEAVEKAVDACLAAIEAEPENPRFRFQLGRVLLIADLNDEAFEQLSSAAEDGHGGACYYLARFQEEPEIARELLERGAEAGFKPAADALAKILGDEGVEKSAGAGASLALHDHRKTRLQLHMLGPMSEVPGHLRREVSIVVENLGDAGQQVMVCSYGDPQSENWETFYFWYAKPPANLGEIVRNYADHPLRALGAKAVTTAPATSGEALTLIRESQQALSR